MSSVGRLPREDDDPWERQSVPPALSEIESLFFDDSWGLAAGSADAVHCGLARMEVAVRIETKATTRLTAAIASDRLLNERFLTDGASTRTIQ